MKGLNNMSIYIHQMKQMFFSVYVKLLLFVAENITIMLQYILPSESESESIYSLCPCRHRENIYTIFTQISCECSQTG